VLGLYVHIPFCSAICNYCNFNRGLFDADQKTRYMRALLTEISRKGDGSPADTIFFGGGTPSLLEPSEVQSIIDACRRTFALTPDAEITLEANPTSVEATRFAGYRAAGVNRVSLGVQALDDVSLKELGRLHSAKEALDAVAIARHAFDRYSFDLIYARPGQTTDAWRAELTHAIDEAAEHLSLYQLTIEPDTPFAALHAGGKLVIPDDDNARALFDVTQEIAAARGLPAYEISNHARAGAECRHNLVYWRYHEYAGIGPGAHGRLVIDGTRHATSTEKRPESWLMRVEASGDGLVTDETLTRTEQADEYLLMGLRLAEGIDPQRYAAFSGHPLDEARIAALGAEGMIEQVNGRLRVTRAGFPVLDAVVADLAA
jgi:oxygen-independent coproporphyrinogen-3 oxidase